MTEAASQEAFGLDPKLFSMEILAPNHHMPGAQNGVGEFRDAETALFALLFPLDRDYLRIADRYEPAFLLPHREVDGGQPDIKTYLRSCQPYAGRAVHGLNHIPGNFLKLAIKEIYRNAHALKLRRTEFEDGQKHKGEILVGTDLVVQFNLGSSCPLPQEVGQSMAAGGIEHGSRLREFIIEVLSNQRC